MRLIRVIAVCLLIGTAYAERIPVELTVIEKELVIDNAGNTQAMWTYNGTVPGPVIRVTEGDIVEFSLTNHEDNEQSHSMDFHAAVVDVLDEFASIKPGEMKDFTFEANYPGVFIYHCGSSSMAEHIARGMYGVIIVDPKEGYSEDYPQPDREYVLVEGDLFEEGASSSEILMGDRWKATLVNGRPFHYSPVHDSNASLFLEAKPGERVRIFFVNAKINESAALHPIAGIWDRVWDNGHPKNVLYGMQTFDVPPAHGATFDIVPPADRPTNNAIVDHRMKYALTGAVSVLINHDDASEGSGRDDQILPRAE